MPSLLDPITLGAIEAPNRIVMAPLTRGRATHDHVPTALMGEYYTQRAAAGLIITEATGISREGLGWPYAPGIWSDAQVEGWKPIVDAVHKAGGRIALQLWHMGRLVHPDFLDGAQPVSSSASTAPAQAHTYDGKKPYGQARALRLDEIGRLLDDYAHAARNAMAAGFDGVEIHAANGYLIDQFLRDGTNTRDDAYGGPVGNRIRLLREVAERVAAEAGAGRTGVRMSPNEPIQGVDDSDPHTLFAAAAASLSELELAFLELREPGPKGTFGRATRAPVAPVIKQNFGGPLVLNCDYDEALGQAALDDGHADAIAFGRPFIANPDLVERLRTSAPLNKDVQATWYSRGPEGYTDYPTVGAAS